MKRFSTYLSLLSLFVLLVAVSFAQPMGPGNFEGPGQQDGSRIVQKLNRALENAGGEGLLLSAAQEEDIAALLEEQLANRPPRDPENRNFDHFKAYGDAIMAGDQAAIERIAVDMANQMAERTAARLVAQANFQITLLGILDGDQIQALQDQHGQQGLLRLLSPRGKGRGGKMGGADSFSRQRTRNSSRSTVTGP